MRQIVLSFSILGTCLLRASASEDLGPILPPGFVADVVAAEPLVSNPCVMAFDRQGRICIGQGPQYRNPTPETPGDRVDILIDDNGDGTADRVHTFADGFNCIQGLAWKGNDLWVANAPDLTVVRDLDGDDRADEYVRVYTDLGNLEHALHGLNFGPDGRLYMTKGNSRGYNREDHFAPAPFRELWGLATPDGAVDHPLPETFTREEYHRNYHTPADDWGQQGGILRCDADGNGLEIVARGCRNPWDAAFDDQFCWLATDNDQTLGDKIFAPFFGSQFGWGHAWSYDWAGEHHLPTVPASAPLFEGSGTGVVHYHAQQFPSQFRDVFFVNDWLRREVYVFRPRWDDALMTHDGDFPSVFAHAGGGRSMPASSGRVFEPTDIEVGPDGALYILSWGHAYGATIKNERQVDVGRVYRIRHDGSPLVQWKNEHRTTPLADWTLDQLFTDLGCSVGSWRTNAQEELVRRGPAARKYLSTQMQQSDLATAQQTWTQWTLGRLSLQDRSVDDQFIRWALDDNTSDNMRLQSIRILADRCQRSEHSSLPDEISDLLTSGNARLRHEAVLAIHQANQSQFVPHLLNLVSRETDRVTFYSAWTALRGLSTVEKCRTWLSDDRAGVRLAALLGLLEESSLEADEVLPFRQDPDQRIAELAEMWLQKTGGADPIVQMTPPPGDYSEPVLVTLKTDVEKATVTYTLDGSVPVKTSTRYTQPIPIGKDQLLKVHVGQQGTQVGPIVTGRYQIRRIPPYRHREFINDIRAGSRHSYEMDWTGLSVGKRHYTDREYAITAIPNELRGLPFLRTSNNDDRSSGPQWLTFTTDTPMDVLVAVDVRCQTPLQWMRIGHEDGFTDTGLELETTDPVFQIYRKSYPAGEITLGGNTNHPQDSSRGNYIVIFDRTLLIPDAERHPAQRADILKALATASAERGRELVLHPRGAGCIKCHRIEGRGNRFAPDLSDIGSRARRPEIMIESILNPSAVITEGFAQHQIVTTDGKVITGAILEETGRSLTLVDAEAQTTTIMKSDIEERVSTKVSAMPAGFDRMMTAQQLADIVVWLATLQAVNPQDGFWFNDTPDQTEIHFGSQQIATWVKRHPKMTRPGLANVRTPSGLQVTRNFPPRLPEDLTPGQDKIDHPMMHPGIWISFGDVDGNDYWRLKAKVAFDGFVDPPTGSAQQGSFTVRNLYQHETDAKTVCTETTRYQFQRVEAGILLRIDATFQSDERDFYFGDQEESGLAIRVAAPIRVDGGNGTILNDTGLRNGKQIWGRPAKWFDYFGEVDGRQLGLMVASSPSNPRPSWLHARDYGVVVTNPFPKQPRERREPYVKTWVRKGMPLELSWAVLIHDLPAEHPLDRDAAYKQILETLRQAN